MGVDEIHTSEFMFTPREVGASAIDGDKCLGWWAGSWGGVCV